MELEISVDGVSISPLIDILSVPFAYKSEKAVDAAGIAGNLVDPATPNTGQVLKWDGSQWSPQEDNTGSGLTLPFEGTNTSNENAFSITNEGSNGYVAKLTSNNSSTSALGVFQNGMGYCSKFRISNTNSSGTVLKLENSGEGDALRIQHDGGDGNAIRIDVNNSTNNDRMIFAINNGLGVGAWFEIDNPNNDNSALLAFTNGTGYAGEFDGDVRIYGELFGGKIVYGTSAFVINHPQFPKDKILRHSSISSPEMVTVYKGRAKLRNGIAVIELPSYFDALNKTDNREINLTCINGWSPLYLDGEIAKNQFTIKTTDQGEPNQEFSWVIYGVRNDQWAKDHPLVLEQEKGVNNRFVRGELIYKKSNE